MRVLALTNCPLDDALGSGYVVRRYSEGLRSRGHSVTVLEPREFQRPRRWERAVRYRQMLGMWLATSRALDFDVVEFYGGEAWLAVDALRLRAERPLVVCHSNGIEPHVHAHLRAAGIRPSWVHPDWPRVMARAFRGADLVLTVSDFDRRFAVAQGYQPPDRVVAIDNPLTTDFLAQNIDQPRDRQVIVCGSWLARKGIDILAPALLAFLSQHRDWSLLLVGVGSVAEPLGTLQPDIQKRVRVVPFIDRESLRQCYLSSAIAVQASHYESFGLASAEAMASGCALVSTRRGFAAGLGEDEAFLVPDLPSSAGLLGALAQAAGDETRRAVVARAGYRRVQALRWPEAIDRYESTLQHWLAQRRGGAG